MQGDRIEHINYVREHKLRPDYEKYILNQIMKPVSQLFELVIEKLPTFPYGKGYYEEMYNIWYNKYDGNDLKTEKKIKQLKAKMVQQLIFEPLLQHSRIQASNNKTIDNWFKPVKSTDNQILDNIIEPEKVLHQIKVKKNKQLSLDKFFK